MLSGGHKVIANNSIIGTMPLGDYMRMMARYGYVILRLQ